MKQTYKWSSINDKMIIFVVYFIITHVSCASRNTFANFSDEHSPSTSESKSYFFRIWLLLSMEKLKSTRTLPNVTNFGYTRFFRPPNKMSFRLDSISWMFLFFLAFVVWPSECWDRDRDRNKWKTQPKEKKKKKRLKWKSHRTLALYKLATIDRK